MQDEKQFKLLIEVYFFVAYQPGFVCFQLANPNEKKEGKTRVILEDSAFSIYDKRRHGGKTNDRKPLFVQAAFYFYETIFKNV